MLYPRFDLLMHEFVRNANYWYSLGYIKSHLSKIPAALVMRSTCALLGVLLPTKEVTRGYPRCCLCGFVFSLVLCTDG